MNSIITLNKLLETSLGFQVYMIKLRVNLGITKFLFYAKFSKVLVQILCKVVNVCVSLVFQGYIFRKTCVKQAL